MQGPQSTERTRVAEDMLRSIAPHLGPVLSVPSGFQTSHVRTFHLHHAVGAGSHGSPAAPLCCQAGTLVLHVLAAAQLPTADVATASVGIRWYCSAELCRGSPLHSLAVMSWFFTHGTNMNLD